MGKILIIEDDLDLCATYIDLFESLGHTVRAITSSTQAIDVLVRERMRPDVVILDMNLPGDSGIIVLGFIRRLPRLANTKIIIVSGFPDMANRAVAQWGADMFLPKPVSMQQLMATVGGNSGDAPGELLL